MLRYISNFIIFCSKIYWVLSYKRKEILVYFQLIFEGLKIKMFKKRGGDPPHPSWGIPRGGRPTPLEGGRPPRGSAPLPPLASQAQIRGVTNVIPRCVTHIHRCTYLHYIYIHFYSNVSTCKSIHTDLHDSDTIF